MAQLELRVPSALRDYACQRSLVCCHWPWRARVRLADRRKVNHALASHALIQQRFEASFEQGTLPGRRQIAQHAHGRCTLLNGSACTLQEAGGLEALPQACRNFPRSVVAIRHEDDAAVVRVDVVFELACPTAAAHIVADSGTCFSWHSVRVPSSDHLVYPIARWVTRDASIDEQRRAYWRRLDDELPDNICEVLHTLGPLALPFAPVSSMADADELATVWSRLPSSGPRSAEMRSTLSDILTETATREELSTAVERYSLIVRRVAAHGVAAAGIHRGATPMKGFAIAAHSARLTALIASRLSRHFTTLSQDNQRDAIVLAAHASRAALTGTTVEA